MRAKFGALAAAVAAAASAAGATVWARRRRGSHEATGETAVGLTTGGLATAEPMPGAVEPTPAERAPAPAAGGPAPAKPTEGDTSQAPEAAPDAGADAGADELTSLKGIGSVSRDRLAEIGVTTLAQVAAWGDDEIEDVGARIHVSPERIRREDWVGQARAKTGR